MSIVPKVTACPETAALWTMLTGDDNRLNGILRAMPERQLMIYRQVLRQLAGRVDAEIHSQFTTETEIATMILDVSARATTEG